jgi:hypothetical protein
MECAARSSPFCNAALEGFSGLQVSRAATLQNIFCLGRHGIIQSFPSLAVNSSAFSAADPEAVLSKIHHTRAPVIKLASCGQRIQKII